MELQWLNSVSWGQTCSGLALALGATLKIPQIMRLRQTRSASGLSAGGLFLETACLTAVLLYHLQRRTPLALYGECAVLWVQDLYIQRLVARWQPGSGGLWLGAVQTLFVAAVSGAVWDPVTLGLPSNVTEWCFWLTMPVGWFATLLQIAGLLRQGSRGSVSGAMLLFGTASSVTRCLSLVLSTVRDSAAEIGAFIGGVLSVVFLAVFLLLPPAAVSRGASTKN